MSIRWLIVLFSSVLLLVVGAGFQTPTATAFNPGTGGVFQGQPPVTPGPLFVADQLLISFQQEVTNAQIKAYYGKHGLRQVELRIGEGVLYLAVMHIGDPQVCFETTSVWRCRFFTQGPTAL